jgi:hypothetical protein
MSSQGTCTVFCRPWRPVEEFQAKGLGFWKKAFTLHDLKGGSKAVILNITLGPDITQAPVRNAGFRHHPQPLSQKLGVGPGNLQITGKDPSTFP